MLLNRDRATEIVEREKLDGLVAQLPVNVYDLTNYLGICNSAFGDYAAYISAFCRAITMNRPD